MAWAIISSGLCSRKWTELLYEAICQLRGACPERDFLLDSRGLPLGYCGMLGHLRRCLVVHAGLSKSVACLFSLHS